MNRLIESMGRHIFPQISSSSLSKPCINVSVISNHINRYMILNTLSLLLFLLALSAAVRQGDIVNPVPGYPTDFPQKVYSGYLSTDSSSRRLHYVFIESSKTDNDTPVTLWLNGGPGCSSLLGFLQEIGPFYLEEGKRYHAGDHLTPNPHSWHKHSHLLFLESPAGVGYSINTDKSFQHTDHSTAEDNLHALMDFFKDFSGYSKNPFWLAGQSYAGKYIPDLAVLIDQYNVGSPNPINLKGVLVGNGIMTYEDGDLQKAGVEYMVDHEFIDPQLVTYYRGSCYIDPASAGCRYFFTRYYQNIDEINPYNVYDYCYYNGSTHGEQNSQSQASILRNIIKNKGKYTPGNNGPTCAYFSGVRAYFTAHQTEYHSTVPWNGPCADDVLTKYRISLQGSMDSYRYLLAKVGKYSIVLFSGDWDSVVPYRDTQQNIQKLNIGHTYLYSPFFEDEDDQHSGFIQQYDGLAFLIVKGASHQVPQSKRSAAEYLFQLFVQAHH